MEITKKQLDEIEQVLGYPLERLYSNKDFKDFVEHSDLDKSTKHQILDVLDSKITMQPDEATKIVREYLRSRKNAK